MAVAGGTFHKLSLIFYDGFDFDCRLAWLPPDMMGKLSLVKRIFITEGIFDAMALMEHGYHAISSISCNNYPHIALQQIKDQCNRLRLTLPTLFFAYNNAKAGQR